MYHMPLDEIISMGSKVNPLVSDLKTLVMFAVAPFNIVKGVLCCAYKSAALQAEYQKSCTIVSVCTSENLDIT